MDIANSGRRKVEITRALADGAPLLPRAYRIHDTKLHGLSLKVHPTGKRTWCLDWARNKSITLGTYPVITVAAARERARAALVERDALGAPAAALPPPGASPTTLLGDFIAGDFERWLRGKRPDRADKDLADLKLQFGATFYAVPIADITVAAADAWTAARVAGGVKMSTARRSMSRLKGVLSKAAAWGVVPASPLAPLKLGRDKASGKVRWLQADEDARLRAALAARDFTKCTARDSANRWRAARGHDLLPGKWPYADHLTPLVLLAMHTGLRRGELTGIVWSDVDMVGKIITVRAEIAKAEKARHVPLNTEAFAVLTAWKACAPESDDDRVFPVDDPKKAWYAVLGDAGISEFRFHDLRHTFASRLVMAGVSLSVVRELMGHATFAMTLRYAHLAPEHHAQAVETLIPKPTPVPAHPPPAPPQAGDVDELRALLLKMAEKLGG